MHISAGTNQLALQSPPAWEAEVGQGRLMAEDTSVSLIIFHECETASAKMAHATSGMCRSMSVPVVLKTVWDWVHTCMHVPDNVNIVRKEGDKTQNFRENNHIQK